jgi:hypothetical protein
MCQDRLNLRAGPLVVTHFVHNPVNQLFEKLGFDRSTGFADGPQHLPSPVLRTTLVQGVHEKTVRCADEIHVAGLPFAVAHLTISQSQLLLAVPMERLSSCPAMALDEQHPNHFPE